MSSVKYSIKMVSAMTGLSSHLIRAWEKRYNAIQPSRSSGERRLFSEADVQRLVALRDAVSSGYRISEIAGKTTEDLVSLARSAKTNFHLQSEVHLFSAKALETIERYSPAELENTLFEASLRLKQDELIYEFIMPLIKQIGDRWHQGIFNIAQEHLSTPVLVSFLHYLRGIYKLSTQASVMLTCAPKGQFHELGALLVSVISASYGWKVIHLGTNLPAYEIAAAAEFIRPKVICLSIIYPFDDPELKKDLLYFKRNIREEIKVIAGGEAAISYNKEIQEAGIKLLQDFREFKKYLNMIFG